MAKAFEGFETLKVDVKMSIKMYIRVLLFFIMVHVVITVLVGHHFHREDYGLALYYLKDELKTFPLSNMEVFKICIADLFLKSIPIFIKTSWIYIFCVGLIIFFRIRSERQSEDKYIAGAKEITSKRLNRQVKASGESTSLRFGDVQVPVSAEPKHCLIIGRPGSGKTQSILQNLEILKERGEKKVIVYDYKGDYLAKFYEPEKGDMIFNPLDARGVDWNVFSEIKIKTDIPAISHSLVPPATHQETFWIDAARSLFAGGLHYLYRNGQRDNHAIWSFVSSDVRTIAKLLDSIPEGREGFVFVQDASSKQAMSIVSVLMQYTACFQYMSAGLSDFSISRWLGRGEGWIFITNFPDIQDTLRPVLSLAVDILARKLLSMPDDHNRRIFFFLDEFGTLQQLSSIKNLLTISRSKGGCVSIGIQDTGQVDRIYSPFIRQALVNACGSAVMFSVADPDTSEFLSKKIGDVRYSRANRTRNMGTTEKREGLSIARQEATERLVYGSDITNLRDLECYVKIPNYHIVKTKIQYKNYPDKHIPFIIKPGLALSEKKAWWGTE